MRTVEDILSHPLPQAKAGTRWWWYGCSVTKSGISHQLDDMAAAGLGSCEIQILYPLSKDDPTRGIKHLEWFSPEFFEILEFTLKYASSCGIKVDFTLGSGWPFGGSFVTEDMAPRTLIPISHDVYGPTCFEMDYTCTLPGEIVKVILVKIERGVMRPETAADITQQVETTWLYSWPWGKRLKEVAVPEGAHKIYLFVDSRYRQPVGIPTQDMRGYAIDHCRKDVSDHYFHVMGDTLAEHLGEGVFQNFFCDSIELGGNNWTPTLLEEFEKRRGYSLTRYLPALWGDMGNVTACIRHDYYLTFSELTLENFFGNFTDWCHRWGSLSRVQAHGTWADILKAYGSADIPEGETFGEHDHLEVNTIHRRLAVSSGQVYEKRIVSNESFTWLRMPRFLVTPEIIKRAADAIFCDGINRIVNHGWTYSHEDELPPGLAFYASSMISPGNTWWPYYPEVSAYIHRVSSLMQEGALCSQVGIYLPQGDVWSDSPISELHMALKLEQYIGRETANHLQKNGYWFTYLNDDALTEKGLLEQNGMRIGNNRYRAILLVGCTRLPLAVARALREFVARGGLLICTDQPPSQSCGWVDYASNSAEVAAIMAEVFPAQAGEWRTIGDGRAAVAPNRLEGLTELLETVLLPDVTVSDGNGQIGFVHRRLAHSDMYFVANIADSTCCPSVSFQQKGKGFVIYDLANCCSVSPLAVEEKEDCTAVQWELEANGSYAVEFSSRHKMPVPVAAVRKCLVQEVSGWSLSIAGNTIATNIPSPVCWQTYPGMEHYSGEGSYRATFCWPKTAALQAEITLDHVNCCAEVILNSKPVARLYRSPWRADISSALKRGENSLEIRVVNAWFNSMLNPAREEPAETDAVIPDWPYFSQIVDQNRQNRLYGNRERNSGMPLQPAGLSGCVQIWQPIP